MSSSHDDRLAEIKKTYRDAKDNQFRDLAAAKTDAQTEAILDNVQRAGQTYFDALHEILAANGDAVEAAFEAAKAANEVVAVARAKAGAIAEVIGKLRTATGAAATLLNTAKA